MEFVKFREIVLKNFKDLYSGQNHLYLVDVDKDELWNTYLNAFPEDIRQKYNCNHCKSFIRQYSNIVAIDSEYQTRTFWDLVCGDTMFQNVANKMKELILSHPINSLFLTSEKEVGVKFNYSQSGIKWNHFYIDNLDTYNCLCRKSSIDTIIGDFRSTVEVFRRALQTISSDSIEVVFDLIQQNSLYRGEEFRFMIDCFKPLKRKYDDLEECKQLNFCFKHVDYRSSIYRIRNSSIGTLLVDLSEGMDVDRAVRRYEDIVAPANYKRPTALVTKSMIADAQKTVSELGYLESLDRRHATSDEITVNNVIFANRGSKVSSNVFDSMKEEVLVNPKKFSKVEEIGIEDFISKVVPNLESIEVLMENRLENNLMNITAPVHPDAKSMFKWSNGYAWSYNGNLADSIKEKVKAAGGNTEGVLRCSLHWFNYDDLDIHCSELLKGRTFEIYYGNKHGISGGVLDVDMNAGSGTSRDAVENIIWENVPKDGIYRIFINNYSMRETIDVGFEVEVEYNGEVTTYSYDEKVKGNVNVIEFEVVGGVFKMKKEYLNSSTSIRSKNIWGIDTSKFQKVSMIMLSPNYWDNLKVGNKHYFFIIDKCLNPSSTRGFFNEYLDSKLDKHRKVFEILGNKTLIPYSNSQLCGLGFSSTVHNSIVVRVKGSFERVLKIKF